MQAPQLGNVSFDHLLERLILNNAAIETASLKRIYGLIRIQAFRQRIIFQHIAPMAVHQEQGWLRTARPYRYKRRPGRLPIFFSQHVRQVADGRRL